MDIIPRVTGQLIDRFQEMSFVQRAISLAFVVAVAAGFGSLLLLKTADEFQSVSFGKVFAPDELASAEKVLTKSGLTGFRRNGQRLQAPKKDLDRYNAALLEFDALPADLGTQMIKQYETLGPFSTDRHRQQMKEALLLQELRRMIKGVPGIDDARVAIASSDRRIGWNHKPRANGAITPRAGREISATLITSLQHVVASMVPDLSPADVTIFDVTRGQAFTGETPDDSMESRLMSQARDDARNCEQLLLKALSHIPQVGVVVQVDMGSQKLSRIRKDFDRSRAEMSPVANRPATIDDPENHLTGFRGNDESNGETQELSGRPKVMRINVTIPRDYLHEIARRAQLKRERSATPPDLMAIEDELLLKVERTVGRLISAETGKHVVTVTCVDRLDSPPADLARPTFNLNSFHPYYLWAGIGGLCLLMLFAWGGHRSSKPGFASEVSAEPHSIEQRPFDPPLEADAVPHQVHSPDRATVLREEIRALVQSDPAASADLLGRWLSEAYP